MLSFKGGFHGRTYGALSLMDKPHYKDGMQPFLDAVSILDYNNPKQLEEYINDGTCAVFTEFIQGEGGIISASGEFIAKLKELHEKFGFLIVADEIQSGVGRTGKFFSFENYNIKPDIVTLAKGIGGGLPLGCILAKESLAGVWEKGMHGTTNGGNSVACAAGLSVLKEIENGLMDKVRTNGEYLFSRLDSVQKAFPEFIREIRGKGLMCGIFLTFDAAKLVALLLENGVITNAASGNVLRLVPPLIVGRKEIDEFINAITACFNQIKVAT